VWFLWLVWFVWLVWFLWRLRLRLGVFRNGDEDEDEDVEDEDGEFVVGGVLLRLK